MEIHVQSFPQGAEEDGHELGAAVGSNVSRYTVFREDVSNEELSQAGGIHGVRGRDEDALLGESVNNDEDGGKAGGLGKVFNEVHGYGIPRMRQNRELLNQTVRLVLQGLRPTAGRTRGAEVVDELPDSGPSILAMYEFHSLINPKVSSKKVIVFVLKDTQAEILRIQNVEPSFIAQVTLGTRAQIPTGYMVKTLRSQSTCDSNMPSDQMLSTF